MRSNILKRTVNGKVQRYTLKQLKADNNVTQEEMFEIGGCGCFVTDEELMA